MSPFSRAAALPALLVLGACASSLPPAEELVRAERDIDSGATARGARRMEAALLELDERDPARWNRLGELAAEAAPEVARRAFDRAESLLWPDASPQSETRLTLPVVGRWLVTQGNRGAFSHRRLADRFAWDLQRVDERGVANAAGSDGPARFFAFGAPVFAPADGVVERASDGVPDNADGERNYAKAGGNVVVVRHGPRELSHFCHLMSGSIAVREGESVRRGDLIGRCGVSGNAVEPHLHVVLRMGPTSEDASIPARFEGVRIFRNGVPVDDADGVPREGDVVESDCGERDSR